MLPIASIGQKRKLRKALLNFIKIRILSNENYF